MTTVFVIKVALTVLMVILVLALIVIGVRMYFFDLSSTECDLSITGSHSWSRYSDPDRYGKQLRTCLKCNKVDRNYV